MNSMALEGMKGGGVVERRTPSRTPSLKAPQRWDPVEEGARRRVRGLAQASGHVSER